MEDQIKDQIEETVRDNIDADTVARAVVNELSEEMPSQTMIPSEQETETEPLHGVETETPSQEEILSQPESVEAEDKTKQPIISSSEQPASTEPQCSACQFLSDKLNSLLCGGPNQKKLCELTLSDVLLWKNVPVSGILFGLGHVLYFLLQVAEVSIVSLVARCLFYPIILAFFLVVVRRAVQNENPAQSQPQQKQSSEEAKSGEEISELKNALQPYVDALIRTFNRFLNFYLSVLFCKDIWVTVKFAILLHFVACLGTVLSTTNILYIAFWLAFSVPKFYVMHDQQIDAIWDKIQSNANEIFQSVKSKIPIGNAAAAAAAPAQHSKHKHQKKD